MKQIAELGTRTVEYRANKVAEKMARLVAVVERSRTDPDPQPRRSRGEELEAVIELAEQFPMRACGELHYPVLKRLLKPAALE